MSDPTLPSPGQVALTEAAERELRRLVGRHGPVMFHQSGGCCDGSSPMCFPRGEFRVGGSDVLVGTLALDDEPVQVWMSASQYEYWKHTFLTIDVVEGRGAGFSLEAPDGIRFLIRSRLLTEAESAELAEPVRGPA